MKAKILFFVTLIIMISMFASSQANLRYMTPLNMSPASPGVGDSVTFTVQMKAQSGDGINVHIIGGIDGSTIYNQTFANIPAGETRDLSFTWTVTSGSHTTWFHMDPDELTGDPYPENNYIEIIFSVGVLPPDEPNLHLSVMYSPLQFNAGDLIHFALIVDNNGIGPTSATTMSFKQNGSTLHTYSVPAITEPASPISFTYEWTAVCDAVILVEINYSDVLPSDNSWTKTMSCKFIIINPDILRKFKLYEWNPIPFPPDPWWHDFFQKGDPVDLLKQIGRMLGEQEKPYYNSVKGLWMKFLKNSNGLNPNIALKLITEESSKIGESKFKNQKELRGFANNLKNTLNDMSNAAANFLKNTNIQQLKLNSQVQ